ncbi:hypothetical protein AB0N17_19845 [Streptomyces sp. NPDC051133]|uniref:hypothetical protein n=1 Tax=Streptomyces sp. NPDC051133 TaxID=3155521 RepID=UPI00342E0858
MTEDRSMQAEEALARVRKLDAAVRRESRWGVRHLALYAVAGFVFTFVVGMLDGPAIAVASVVWAAFTVGISLWAARQKVHREGYGRRQRVVIAVWGAVYAVVICLGSEQHDANPLWWLLGAVATAAPAAVGAVVESRA